MNVVHHTELDQLHRNFDYQKYSTENGQTAFLVFIQTVKVVGGGQNSIKN